MIEAPRDAPLLVTERLELWLPTAGDFAATMAIVADGETARHLGPAKPADHGLADQRPRPNGSGGPRNIGEPIQ